MLITLNIGMWIGGNSQSNIGHRTVIADVVQTLRPTYITTANRFASSGEPTLVIKVIVTEQSVKEITPAINFLCLLLQQDCIAGMTDGGEGFLIGPNTAPYGDKFDAAYFLPH